ncbi:MAG: mandelate racemase [Planctomycetota bacterium]
MPATSDFDPPRFSILEHRLHFRLAQARLPFHFGVMTLKEAWQVTLVVTIEDAQGRRAQGVAGDTLAPRWFDKDLSRSIPQNLLDLVDAADAAGAAFTAEAKPLTLFERWRPAYNAAFAASRASGRPDLVGSYGAALFERALWSALCRLTGQPFHAVLRANLGGLVISGLHPDVPGLADFTPADLLPTEPRRRIVLRHTVGGADPLTRADDCAGDPADGRPYTLEENIRRFGLYAFKLKIFGRLEEDLARLGAIARVLDATVPAPTPGRLALDPAAAAAPYFVTIDGNESYADFAAVEEIVARLRADPALKNFCRAILFIEQPLNRAVSFDPVHRAAIARLNSFKPIVIDEADQNLDSFRQAADLGYRGVSAKNCKGVIKSLANRALMTAFAQAGRGAFVQSGEDLTNLPVVPLGQDLATLASLGILHAERNGHHFYAGAEHLPAELRAAAAAEQPGLYELDRGRLFVRIAEGLLNLDQVVGAGYGLTPALEKRCAASDGTLDAAAWRAQIEKENQP